jgi:hypothetical protein
MLSFFAASSLLDSTWSDVHAWSSVTGDRLTRLDRCCIACQWGQGGAREASHAHAAANGSLTPRPRHCQHSLFGWRELSNWRCTNNSCVDERERRQRGTKSIKVVQFFSPSFLERRKKGRLHPPPRAGDGRSPIPSAAAYSDTSSLAAP